MTARVETHDPSGGSNAQTGSDTVPGRGALAHLRVLDLSRVLAGPWCGQILADLGADVIKVERPEHGDDTRAWGPPWMPDRDGAPTTESAYFSGANRNKRSITADLSKPAAQAMVRALAAKSDVVIENYKAGGLAKYGLDWPSLSRDHPALVYCSITGFGHTGPWAPRPGYDFIIQGIGGLMSFTGERDDLPGGGPQKVGVAVADLMTGLYATIAILAALAHRDRTGVGQHVDMALLDTQVAMTANIGMNWLASGEVPRRLGNANPNIVPYQTFATSDGHLILAVGNDSQFRHFCAAAGCPALADDPRFATNPARVEHRDVLVPLLAARLRERSMSDWIAALEAAGVPCGPINTLDRTFAEPQAVARGLKVTLPHPTAGEVDLIASPLRLSATPVEYRRAPPLLGEHTDEVLRDVLGLDAAAIAALKTAGAV